MNFLTGVTVVSITIICYPFVEFVKATRLNNKWLPIVAAFIGGILGVIGMFTIKEYPANDILSAIAIGVESGLASTGVNQIYKQLTKDK